MERAEQFIGQSLAFLDAVEVREPVFVVGHSFGGGVPVLVIGERGTGKELIGERLHHLSSRWAGPLIIMNCAALPENLIEAELFGHEAGSFTGAVKTRHGRFEEADGGTLITFRHQSFGLILEEYRNVKDGWNYIHEKVKRRAEGPRLDRAGGQPGGHPAPGPRPAAGPAGGAAARPPRGVPRGPRAWRA